MGTPLTPTELNIEPNPRSVLWGCFVGPFLDGSEPLIRHLRLKDLDRAQDLVPPSARLRMHSGDHHMALLAEASGWTVLVTSYSTGYSDVFVRAQTEELLEKGVADVRSRAPEPEKEPDRVVLDFWQVSTNGPFSTTRVIDAPTWDEISHHYPGEVGDKVLSLRDVELDMNGGRIVLWHGPPGTGKTTAIRALAREWGETRRVQILLDPEVIFAQSSMLMSVLLDDEAGEDVWRILVIEDADELLRHDAKDRVGQALSRLLNVGDGILGQGLKVVVLITTNEPIRKLHPALVRPGRCLSEIEFRTFTPAEAKESFGVPTGGTLAQLIHGTASPQVADPPGRYL